MVGKDLTRVCLPVYFNEPLSALQKTAEDLEYSELLDAAAALPPGSVDRLLLVAAFAASAYSSTLGRTAKPFNPLLGETYELVRPEKGWRFLAEKVSHHPTVIAARAEGRAWVFEGDADVKSRFWGRSIELKPEGAPGYRRGGGGVLPASRPAVRSAASAPTRPPSRRRCQSWPAVSMHRRALATR
jgi:hypothetical protein